MTVVFHDSMSLMKENEQLWSDIRETSRQLELTTAELARLRAENERLRKALERELGRLQSLSRIQTHYEGCDSSQGHAICYAARLIREALQ